MGETKIAAILHAPGEIRLEERPLPEPGADEVRVRLEGCGVCASNLPVWEGREWFEYPLEPGAPGHEGWGRVDAVGAGVRHVREGDRVAMLSGHAYATHDVAPADEVVPLPAALDGQPLPGEPLGCALNIFARSDIQAGQTVAVVGIGFLGALLVQLAKGAGARVLALGRRPWALEVARAAGADETITLNEHWRVIEQVKELTGGAFCERTIEATGKASPLDLAGELTGVRGKLIIAGFHQDGLRQVNVQLWNWRGLDVINAHERDPQQYIAGMRAAVDAVASGRLTPASLYTPFPLAQLSDALHATQERPEGFLKAVVTMEP